MRTTPHVRRWPLFLSCCLYLYLLMPLATLATPPLDINTATEADLDSLKGVGPATTQRILTEREKAPFADWANLMARVKGLRPATVRKLSEQGLTVNGEPFAATPSQPLIRQPP